MRNVMPDAMHDGPRLSRRPTRRSRVAVLAGMAVGLAAVFAPGLLRPVSPTDGLAAYAPRLVYNASDSMPRGFYAIRVQPPSVGDAALVRLPAAAARLAVERGYLPAGVPLIKPIAAGYGDHVCVRHGIVRINGRLRTLTLTHDSQGRPLASWPGCRLLGPHEWFLLGTDHSASFDSRYFGPVAHAAVYGVAVPLWVWSAL